MKPKETVCCQELVFNQVFGLLKKLKNRFVVSKQSTTTKEHLGNRDNSKNFSPYSFFSMIYKQETYKTKVAARRGLK